MKKIVYIIIFFVMFFNTPKSISAQVTQNESILYTNIEEPLKVHSLNSSYLFEYVDYFVYKKDNVDLIKEGKLISFVECGESLIVFYKQGIKNVLSRFDNANEKTVMLDDDYVINYLNCFNNVLYLFGNLENYSVLLEYNMNLELTKERMFFENAKVTFENALFYGDKWYVVATKDGHSSSKELYNVGNYDDIKSMIMVFDRNFNLQNVQYFNHLESKEKIKYFNIFEDNIYYVFETETHYYAYRSDLLFLENILLNQIDDELLAILQDVDGNYLYFKNNKTLTMDAVNETINLGNFGKILSTKIKNSQLELIYYLNGVIYKNNIEEYHIEKLEPITITYNNGGIDFEKDLNSLDEIEIKSYFVETLVLCNTNFNKTIPGSYNVELLIERKNLNNIKVSNTIFVEDYVNVTNGNVYCSGISLKFLGYAKLNGQKINNGHSITIPGDYILEIEDNIGNIKVYNFKVVDDYYIRNQEQKYFDYIVKKGEKLEIEFDIFDIIVSDVIVNNESVEFNQYNDKLYVYLDSNFESGIQEYIIEKIISEDLEYQVDKKVIVNVLKDSPEIIIEEENNSNPSFLINVLDYEQTIKYLEILFTNDNEIEKRYYYFNDTFDLENLNFTEGQVEVFICYDLGDGKIWKEELFNFSGSFDNISQVLNFTETIDGNKITSIKVSINKENIRKMKSLSVNDVQLEGKYIVDNDYTSLVISIVLSVFIIFGLIIYLLIKVKKQKKKKTL